MKERTFYYIYSLSVTFQDKNNKSKDRMGHNNGDLSRMKNIFQSTTTKEANSPSWSNTRKIKWYWKILMADLLNNFIAIFIQIQKIYNTF